MISVRATMTNSLLARLRAEGAMTVKAQGVKSVRGQRATAGP
jgi:hypothetical protein